MFVQSITAFMIAFLLTAPNPGKSPEAFTEFEMPLGEEAR